MWASEAQIIWEEAAKKIGIKIKTDWSVSFLLIIGNYIGIVR